MHVCYRSPGGPYTYDAGVVEDFACMLQVVREGSACVSQELGRALYVGTLHVSYRCWGGQCMYVTGVGADLAYVLQVSSRMLHVSHRCSKTTLHVC